jgi:alginate O-acetyltransferase complex protein AlgF
MSCRVVTAALLLFAGVSIAAIPIMSAEPQLYPTGPPHGAAYIRFVNTASEDLGIESRSAHITLPAIGERRATVFQPVVPGSRLSASLELAGRTQVIDLVLAANELVTVAVGGAEPSGLRPIIFREIPSDFNALKASVALYNRAMNCPDARLIAGDKGIVVISGVSPGGVGRQSINPISLSMSAVCSTTPGEVAPAHLGQLEAGERYSVFFFEDPGGAPRAFAIHDQIGSLPH